MTFEPHFTVTHRNHRRSHAHRAGARVLGSRETLRGLDPPDGRWCTHSRSAPHDPHRRNEALAGRIRAASGRRVRTRGGPRGRSRTPELPSSSSPPGSAAADRSPRDWSGRSTSASSTGSAAGPPRLESTDVALPVQPVGQFSHQDGYVVCRWRRRRGNRPDGSSAALPAGTRPDVTERAATSCDTELRQAATPSYDKLRHRATTSCDTSYDKL